ncbi:MAG: cation:proton antiporter [Nitriliruptoraceae bacterium]
MLTPIGEHELLIFWVQIVVLLGVARALGLLAQQLNQPRIVGELAAGVLLGPSVFGRLFPDLAAWIFPGDAVQSALILAIAWLGIAMLLVVTGFETDLALLRKLGRSVVGLSVGSLVVPLTFGFGLGWIMPEVFWGEAANRLSFAMFIGVALSISALTVIAKIMTDLGLMRRNVGQLTIASGMVNDLVGWMLLGVVVSVFTSGRIDVSSLGITVVSVIAFLVLGLTVGQRFADAVLRRARSVGGFGPALTATLLIAFVFGAITQGLGVEAVLGSLVAGVILGRSRYQRADVTRSIEVLSNAIFAPIFFATAGLYVDLGVLFTPSGALWAGLVILVASVAKFTGSYIGGRFSGLTSVESFASGIGLNARGTMELVLATVGLSLGALNEASYAMVILLVVTTSMGAGPALRVVARRMDAAPEEAERLQREKLLATAVIADAQSVLLPTRGGLNSAVAARVVDALLQPESSVTVFTVGTSPDTASPQLAGVTSAFPDRTSHLRIESGEDAAELILEEAGLGYKLVTLGLNDDYVGSHELSEPIQRVIAESPVPMLLVRRGQSIRDAADLRHRPFRRIIVSVTGTRQGRAAEELAFRLATRYQAQVLGVHVVTRGSSESEPSSAVERQFERVREVAGAYGADISVVTRHAPAAAEELARVATDWQADTIVIGASQRATEGRPFLGHGTEWLLEHATQTVIGVVFPQTSEED